MPFHHKNIRLSPTDYTGERWFFLTLCCAEPPQTFHLTTNLQWFSGYPPAHRHTIPVCHPRILPNVRSHSPARRRPLPAQRCPPIHARPEKKHVHPFPKKDRRTSLAEKILRPHSTQQRFPRRSRLVHLDEPSPSKPLPQSGGVSLLGFPHPGMEASAPTHTRVAPALAQTPERVRSPRFAFDFRS